jgi:signal transduction histidine kinase
MAIKPAKHEEDEDGDAYVFRVDTHLFRELGNYLVGRDSTALIELVKNAYDADATEVHVTGTNLSDTENGVIIVSDNGSGMSEKQFRNGFLTIASRAKEEGDRRSPHYHRRYTGAKGIGRLAAHKLAEHLDVRSVSGTPGEKSQKALTASIDWRAIETHKTLDQVTSEVNVAVETLRKPASCGTRIELRQLRKAWTDIERTHFVDECFSLQAPEALLEPICPRLLKKALLFDTPTQRLTSGGDGGFKLTLDDEFTTGEPFWQKITQTAEWVIEIDATRPESGKGAKIRYGIAPTVNRESQPGVKAEIYSRPHPASGPFFQARILVQVNPKDKANERARLRKQSGVRVYVEGFRVLPYGEDGNDWLDIDANYTRRSRLDFAKDVEELVNVAEDDPKWTQTFLPNRSYFGAVFITQDEAGELTPLVNREGFLPNHAYVALKNSVRLGIDLFTRVRAAAEYVERAEARVNRRRIKGYVGSTVLTTIDDARETVKRVRVAVASSDSDAVLDGIGQLSETLNALQDDLGDIVTQANLMRVTASIGTQMAEFVHEIQILLGTAQTVNVALGRLSEDMEVPKTKRAAIQKLHVVMSDMKRQLDRQASYLLDIATPDASRRRSKQKLAERFNSAVKLVARAAEKREIDIVNEIPEDLKCPAMFPAEITTVFSNLLTNAVKNAGDGGAILAQGERTEGSITVTIQNTGNAVDVDTSERLFLPYVSSTSHIDPVLGQGMGLGLSITRSTLAQYGATIRFVKPEKKFKTAIRITFPV